MANWSASGQLAYLTSFCFFFFFVISFFFPVYNVHNEYSSVKYFDTWVKGFSFTGKVSKMVLHLTLKYMTNEFFGTLLPGTFFVFQIHHDFVTELPRRWFRQACAVRNQYSMYYDNLFFFFLSFVTIFKLRVHVCCCFRNYLCFWDC